MNILVIGLAGHGKDEFGKIIEKEFGMTYLSSSEFALNRGVFDHIWEHEGLSNRAHFWLYKDNYRPQMFKAIEAYNVPKSRLADEVFQYAHAYIGMRSRLEFNACCEKELFDHVVWIDATERLGLTETVNSIQLTAEDADTVLYNNGTKEQFITTVKDYINNIVQ